MPNFLAWKLIDYEVILVCSLTTISHHPFSSSWAWMKKQLRRVLHPQLVQPEVQKLRPVERRELVMTLNPSSALTKTHLSIVGSSWSRSLKWMQKVDQEIRTNLDMTHLSRNCRLDKVVRKHSSSVSNLASPPFILLLCDQDDFAGLKVQITSLSRVVGVGGHVNVSAAKVQIGLHSWSLGRS